MTHTSTSPRCPMIHHIASQWCPMIHNITSSSAKLPAPGEEAVHFYLNLSECKPNRFFVWGAFPPHHSMDTVCKHREDWRKTNRALSESIEAYFFSFSVTLSVPASPLFCLSPSTSHLLFKKKSILLALVHGLVCTLTQAETSP